MLARTAASALMALLSAATIACAGDAADTADTTAAATDAAPAAMAHPDTLGPRMEAHLQQLSTADATTLPTLVPADRALVEAMIAECEKMMADMKMAPPQKWTDIVRDLRQDLDRMATATGPELQTLIPEHRRRIEEVLAMRRDMMRM